MKRNKLAFVDKEFHKKTRSGDFLREELRIKYEIFDFWHDDKIDTSYLLIEHLLEFENVFFFQTLLPYHHMLKLSRRGIKLVWAPMYDELPLDYFFWKRIETMNIKLLLFSTFLRKRVLNFDISFNYVQYFKMPLFIDSGVKDKLKIFFWYRGSLKLSDWIYIFKKYKEDIDEIVYFSSPDPRFSKEIISQNLLDDFRIRCIEKDFLSKEEYLSFVDDCDVFVCPRKQEGIGMTIVEAISKGKFLIGYDDNTMNDYIISGYNGLLIGSADSYGEVDKNMVNNSLKFRESYAEIGFNNWLRNREIIQGSFDDLPEKNKKYYMAYFYWSISLILQVYRTKLKIFN